MAGRNLSNRRPKGRPLDDPAKCALKLLRELNVESIPIQPRHIAEQLGIVVWEREMARQYDGCLMRVGEAWGILLNSIILSQSRKNFTIAHELGHYHLDQTQKTKHRCFGDDLHGFDSHRLEEQRANQFAVELLMPSPIFEVDADECPEVGLPAIDALASQYGTSLTSTAIRYTRLSPYTCAIVFSSHGRIRYFAYSNGFRWNSDCYLIKDRALHPDSSAYRLMKRKLIEIRDEPEEVPLSYWCSTNASHVVIEHSRYLSRINQVMTFLWLRK